MVSAFAFCSDDPSSNPAEFYSFSVIFAFDMHENDTKSGEGGPDAVSCCDSSKQKVVHNLLNELAYCVKRNSVNAFSGSLNFVVT